MRFNIKDQGLKRGNIMWFRLTRVRTALWASRAHPPRVQIKLPTRRVGTTLKTQHAVKNNCTPLKISTTFSDNT